MAGPNPPRDLSLVSSTATSLDVSWLGQSSEGDVDLYLVSHFPADGITSPLLIVQLDAQQRVKFENLLPNKDYVVTVRAQSGDETTSETSEEITETFTTGTLHFMPIGFQLEMQRFLKKRTQEGAISKSGG